MPTPANLRRSTAALARLAERDLATLMRQAQTPEQARSVLMDALPTLVATYGAAAATLAADWYDEARDAAGVAGSFRAIPADPGALGVPELVGWAESQAASAATMAVLVAGGVQRRIANQARATVTGSSVADPKARGWYRTGDGASCGFCRMLIGRGTVYSQASADFKSHDHCGCYAAPAWSTA